MIFTDRSCRVLFIFLEYILLFEHNVFRNILMAYHKYDMHSIDLITWSFCCILIDFIGFMWYFLNILMENTYIHANLPHIYLKLLYDISISHASSIEKKYISHIRAQFLGGRTIHPGTIRPRQVAQFFF